MSAETLLHRQAEAVAARQAPPAPPALLTSRLIRLHYLPIGERTFWRWISAGKFPKPDLAVSGKAKFWRRETVENWIVAQTEAK